MINSGFASAKVFLPPCKTSTSWPSTSIFIKLGILSNRTTESSVSVFIVISFAEAFKYCSIQGSSFPATHPVADVKLSCKNEASPTWSLNAHLKISKFWKLASRRVFSSSFMFSGSGSKAKMFRVGQTLRTSQVYSPTFAPTSKNHFGSFWLSSSYAILATNLLMPGSSLSFLHRMDAWVKGLKATRWLYLMS